jgi:hypothetical protein
MYLPKLTLMYINGSSQFLAIFTPGKSRFI